MSFKTLPFEEKLGETLKWTILGFVVFVPANQAFREFMPPLEHWASLVGIATFFGAVFTIAGLFVGVDLMKRHKFVLIASGSIATFLALWVIADGNYKAANFCYFKADFSRAKVGGGYEWQLVNDQNRTIMPVKYFLYDGRGGPLVDSWIDEINNLCHQDSIDQTTADEKPILPGEYYYKFEANNSWEQSLVIKETKDGPKQLGIIFRDGDEIDRFGDLEAPNEPR